MSESQRFKQRLHEIIALPSVSSALADYDMGNRAVIDLLAIWLSDAGFRCDIQDLGQGKANLVASLGSGRGGLVLSGHSDTVPYDQARWASDPFALVEKDERLFGLGTCDMKGFFPVVMAAIEAMHLRAEQMKAPLIVLATADEESSMSGARALVKQDLLHSRYAIIGEPTGLVPVRMHKGILMQRLRVRGRAGHSSNPRLGNNAIEAMHLATSELLDLRKALQQKYQNMAFDIPEPTMNLGCIHGGDNANRICADCYLDFDIRLLPGIDAELVQASIEQCAAKIAALTGTQIWVEKLFPGVEAFEQAEDSELVALVEKLTGTSSESVAFATEAPFIQALGMQTIVLGPGSIDQAHQANEHLHLDQINPAINILKSTISHCCL